MELVFGWIMGASDLENAQLLYRAASSVAIFAGGVFVTIVVCGVVDFLAEQKQARKDAAELDQRVKGFRHPRGICSCGSYECEQRARDTQPMSEDVAEAIIGVQRRVNDAGNQV